MPAIGGKVYEDISRSGTYTSGDVLRPGVAIHVTRDSDSSVAATTTTDPSGNWAVTLPVDTYTVRCTPPAGWAALCPTGARTYTVALGATDATSVDFGLWTVGYQVDWVRVWDRKP